MLHPKLVTHRGEGDTPRSTSSALQPLDIPMMQELVEAGTATDDAVVQQLSARKAEAGSLAGPREVPGRGGGAAPDGYAAMGQQLHLSEARLRPAARPEVRPARRTSHGGGVHSGAGLGRSAAAIHPGRSPSANRRPSVAEASQTSMGSRSASRQADPYAHVTSVIHDYCANRISTLEAQFGVARLSAGDSGIKGTPASPQRSDSAVKKRPAAAAPTPLSTAEYGAAEESTRPTSLGYQTAPAVHHYDQRQLRALSPQLRFNSTVRRGLGQYQNYQLDPAQLSSRSYSPANSGGIPRVAEYIPEKYKFVPKTEGERRAHREETLRLLEEWRQQHASVAAPRRNADKDNYNDRHHEVSGSSSASWQRTAKEQQTSQQAKKQRNAAVAKSPRGAEKAMPEVENEGRSPTVSSRVSRSSRRVGRSRSAQDRMRGRRGSTTAGRSRATSIHETETDNDASRRTVNPYAYRKRLIFGVEVPKIVIPTS